MSGSSLLKYFWSLASRILSTTLIARGMCAIVWHFEHSLALLFFGIGMKTDVFQSCGQCWVFRICWNIECLPATSLQSHPTLCDPMDYILPHSFVHGILQVTMLERVFISFSRGSSWPKDRAYISLYLIIAGGIVVATHSRRQTPSEGRCR